jgi:hypothetical protein
MPSTAIMGINARIDLEDEFWLPLETNEMIHEALVMVQVKKEAMQKETEREEERPRGDAVHLLQR